MGSPLQEIADLGNQVERVKLGLIEAIEKLPDNPRISRLGSNTFEMSSKNLENNWSVLYHDFKAQHRKLGKIIRRQELPQIAPVLMGIVERGTFPGKSGTVKFHPLVIRNIKALMEA